jgi:hypothetical protein
LEVFVTHHDFDQMTQSELRAYVIAHPDDQKAFHAFVDRKSANASPETFSPPQSQSDVEEMERLIQQKVKSLK